MLQGSEGKKFISREYRLVNTGKKGRKVEGKAIFDEIVIKMNFLGSLIKIICFNRFRDFEFR